MLEYRGLAGAVYNCTYLGIQKVHKPRRNVLFRRAGGDVRTPFVIEDDPAITELVQLYLENEGYEVVIASDGELGLKLFHSENPDFVILDLGLPKLDGIEVARILRSECYKRTGCR